MAVRLARTRHQLPVDDRVRLAPAFEARPPDRRVDGMRGFLLRVEVADGAAPFVRVLVLRPPPSLALVPQSEERANISADEFRGALASRAWTARDL